MTEKYKVFLPKTSFALKGQLAQKELDWIDWWNEIDLYPLQRKVRKGKELFVLHDGPPYANGNIHLGHALNKILKDMVNRSEFMKGKDISFVPGWDCHGLPIEAKVEEAYNKKKKDKKTISSEEVRKNCRDYAESWIEIQKKEFLRLGLTGDWDNPYKTMDFLFEAKIEKQFFRLLQKGYVYHGIKPIFWSVVEETALAEAEVEYKDVTSHALDVAFPVQYTPMAALEDAKVVIWTTTPWTLPANRAICYHGELSYVLIQVTDVGENALCQKGEKFLVAQACCERFCKDASIIAYKELENFFGTALEGTICTHPLEKEGYEFPVPLLPAEHVSAETGTGFVHTAPGHGIEDFGIGKRYNLEIPETVNANGYFTKSVPGFSGIHIWKAYPLIKEALVRHKSLLADHPYVHSYPHSWRSKTPLIYRTTPQWFISMDDGLDLREHALKAIPLVKWYPASGENRITAMVENRPHWCISRQRVWGVPLCLFVNKETGSPLLDPKIHEDIVERIAHEGSDFWFTEAAWEVLPAEYKKEDFEKITDIIDVWFESGVTHEVVLKEEVPHGMIKPIAWPASLYLEGSDQHRGWFQSSLLTSVALEGKAPYEGVLTHGFTIDEKGNKMSKSLGNVVSPQEVISAHGADVLRLWVGNSNYHQDLRMGPEILKHVGDIYRRFRNTFRYLLGGLQGFSIEEFVEIQKMPSLEKWVHHQLYKLQEKIENSLKSYEFQNILQALHQFCSVELSAFYFDIRKDALYCDASEHSTRKAVRTTFLHILLSLMKWLAPFLCFTAEEVFHHFIKEILELDPKQTIDKENYTLLTAYLLEQGYLSCDVFWSIHLERFPSWKNCYKNVALFTQIEKLRELRKVITVALEQAREKKMITSSLQASPKVYLPSEYKEILLEDCSLADFCLTSSLDFKWDTKAPDEAYFANDIGVVVKKAQGEKCQRCWKILPEVGRNTHALCQRCAQVN